MKSNSDFLALKASISDALDKGARMASPTRCEWDLSGGCQKPHSFTRFARSTKQFVMSDNIRTRRGQVIFGPPPKFPLELLMTVRCRKCIWCKKQRSREWAQRGFNEIMASARTWFGTLTFPPYELSLMRMRADRRASARRGRLEELTDADWFNLVVDECARSVTLWLKRLRRSRSAGSVRYLLVAEAHKSGQPHFHVLLHEYGQPIPARELERQWNALGVDGDQKRLSHFRLVERDKGDTASARKVARYVCKYILKSTQVRVRASGRYGDTSVDKASLETQMRDLVTTPTPPFIRHPVALDSTGGIGENLSFSESFASGSEDHVSGDELSELEGNATVRQHRQRAF